MSIPNICSYGELKKIIPKNEPRHEKTFLCHMRTTKACLISAFVNRYLDSIIPLLGIAEISRS